MVALAANRATPRMGDDVKPSIFGIPVADNVHIFRGAMVALDAAGFARPAIASPRLAIIGMAEEEADNTLSGHVVGGISVRIRVGVFKFAKSTLPGDDITAASAFQVGYAVDDNTVGLSSAGGQRSRAGTIVQVDSDGVWVQLASDSAMTIPADVAPADAAGLGIAQVLFLKAAAGGAGAASDSVIFNANAPYAFRVLETRMLVGAPVSGGSVTVRDGLAGGGNAVSDSLSAAAAGVVRDAAMTLTRTVPVGGTLAVRRSDGAIACEVLITIIRVAA